MYDIGILQGRLSPDPESRFQFFPENWQREFELAQACGFLGVEWLVDPHHSSGWRNNPIFQLLDVGKEISPPVLSVCADWFMEVCPWETDTGILRAVLHQLISQAAHMKNKLILVPLLERHTIIELALQRKVVEVFKPLQTYLEAHDVSIGFETELAAKPLANFIDRFESDHFGVYYDTGNCTSYGFYPPEEIRFLGHRIKGVHLKDRKVGSAQSVLLGDGDTDFLGIFCALRDIAWQGTPILQAWRGPQYLADAVLQLDFINLTQQEAEHV